jgi:Flp pilus assembly protein TadD
MERCNFFRILPGSRDLLHGGSHMNHTVNLVTGLLSTARNLQDLGRADAALNILQRLATFPTLAPAIAEDVHGRLADLYAAKEQFKDARRHLTVALTYCPQNASYHHRMACWIEADTDAVFARAGRYYRCAVRGEPDNAEYWADYGAHLLAVGQKTKGRRALCRAFELASDNADHVGRIAAVLRDAGLWEQARQLLRRALFQSSRDPAFRALWREHQFEQLCHRQQPELERELEPTAPSPAMRPMLLPFVRRTVGAYPLHVDGKILRFDRVTESSEASLPLPKRGPRTPRRSGEW